MLPLIIFILLEMVMSRTLRTFTKQIAKESGFTLNWEELNKNPAGRDILYIARDISINKIALTQTSSEGTKRDILYTLDQLGNNRDMHSLKGPPVKNGAAHGGTAS